MKKVTTSNKQQANNVVTSPVSPAVKPAAAIAVSVSPEEARQIELWAKADHADLLVAVFGLGGEHASGKYDRNTPKKDLIAILAAARFHNPAMAAAAIHNVVATEDKERASDMRALAAAKDETIEGAAKLAVARKLYPDMQSAIKGLTEGKEYAKQLQAAAKPAKQAAAAKPAGKAVVASPAKPATTDKKAVAKPAATTKPATKKAVAKPADKPAKLGFLHPLVVLHTATDKIYPAGNYDKPGFGVIPSGYRVRQVVTRYYVDRWNGEAWLTYVNRAGKIGYSDIPSETGKWARRIDGELKAYGKPAAVPSPEEKKNAAKPAKKVVAATKQAAAAKPAEKPATSTAAVPSAKPAKKVVKPASKAVKVA